MMVQLFYSSSKVDIGLNLKFSKQDKEVDLIEQYIQPETQQT